jgi:hypothetical protein
MSSTLKSPGVSISIIDESQYVSSTTGTIPLILVASAENKTNPSGTIAQYTTSNTAGQLYLETSQRGLVNDFGQPIFQNISGTGVNGDERNEYGLMTAYSTLGSSDAAYIMRAPIDLNALKGNLIPPTSAPANGTVWLDSSSSVWGILQYNAASQTFTSILPTNASGSGKLWVITETSQTSDGAFSVPLSSIGKPGDYAIVLTNVNNPVWYQNAIGAWVEVDTVLWQASVPTAIGTVTNPTATGNLVLNGSNVVLSGANLSTIVTNINGAAISGVTASAISNRVALYATSAAVNNLVNVSGAVATQIGLSAGSYYAPAFQASPYTNVPAWNSTSATPEPTGSIWFNTSTQESGANIVVNVYNSTKNSWVSNPVTVGTNDAELNYTLDPIGGGINISAGTYVLELGAGSFTSQLLTRQSGTTSAVGTIANPTLTGSGPFTFEINTSVAGSNVFAGNVTVSFTGTTSSAIVSAINSAAIVGISAGLTSSNHIQIQNTFGGTFYLYDGANTPLEQSGILPTGTTFAKISNWIAPSYVVSTTAPTADPTDGTLWYYDDPTVADIMINTGTQWAGYRTVTANVEPRGYNLTLTDPAGPIVSASSPLYQSTGNVVVNGDIWINTSDLENLPNINRYQSGSWVQIINTDHTSSNGIVFADARWATSGNVDPAINSLPSISNLVLSNYLDSDAPSYAFYPRGTLLFNTRRSGMNVKEFATDYLTGSSETSAWVTTSGNNESGVAYQGSSAQRNIVVKSLISAIDSSDQILESVYDFNLISCPGYPELIPTLVSLNATRGNTAFVVGDSPMTLAATSNTLNNWSNNLNSATTDGVDGLVTYSDYLGVYYPAGLTTDLSGNSIVVPPSYMALPTIINSDAKSFPWFAPAGPRRGLVTNATSLGYIDKSGDFVPNSVSQSLRDILYPAGVNPISNISGTGLEIYGQKTRASLIGGLTSELSRINIARLVIYTQGKLASIASSFLFEQNDSYTRSSLASAIGTLMTDLQANRAISDWAVDVSTDINTQAIIDANQLWASVAILPITAVEFIYIPLTITGSALTSSGITTS